MTDIQAPDGSIARFPDGMADADIVAVMQKNFPPSDETQYRSPEEGSEGPLYNAGPSLKGAARALENNLPFAPEAVAGLQSVLPQGYGGTGQGYDSNLANQRGQNQQFQADNPYTDLAGAGAVGAAGGSSALPAVGGAIGSAVTSPLAMALARGALKVGGFGAGAEGASLLVDAMRRWK